ncbi:MAG: restriction endonuclease subunit S [Paludibacter sp.]
MSEVNNIPEGAALSLPKGWVETTLGELSTPKGGKRLQLGDSLIASKTAHPYIRITDFSGNTINKQQLLFVPNEVFNSISKYIVNTNDVVISIVGTIGLIAKIDKELNNASLTENCVKLVDLKDINASYLYYFLTSNLGQNEINKNTVGAVQKKLPIYGVQNIIIRHPLIPEQKSIADILTAFDDKIELLQAQNKTLEETAQTIFKEWFGKYQIGDELPEGWRECKLGEEFNISIGRTPPRLETQWFSKVPMGKKWISIKDIGNSGIYIENTSEYLTDEAVKKFNIPIIPKNTTILSFKMTVGKLTITTEDMLSNEAIAHLKIKTNSVLSSEFIYLYLQKLDFNALGSTSSIVTAINSTMIKELEIIVPDSDILKRFNQAVLSLFKKIRTNSTQIQSLTQTRDELLPKLMSGEIRVNEFNK